ncbi:hypothetical protein RI129_012625 [Pyrocoelia pectoralis]|uniref:Carboxylic ester hydrolase n=1 Tax=Pyrocoelia pectoralis TaxID=417401 RepID=A0AAN7Z6C2_9COLE
MLVRCLLVFTTIWCSTTLGSIEISVDQGILKGKYSKTLKGKTFKSFTGIPYAEPPVGELRFKPPIPAKQWEGVLDATKNHSICPQINVFTGNHKVVGNEDCLYLNVYTPDSTPSLGFPVMFYIHGGGWMCGNANSELYGPEMLLEEDVVLVVTNYRLGALGFMSTGDLVVPGNNGLKDQNLALKWVKNNIRHFGGNPDRITIFGQSAGGASSHFHTLSPLSRDLISGAIIQSGTAFAPWAITLNPLDNAKKLANYLNCPTSSSEAIVECLKTVNAYEIVEQDTRFTEYSFHPVIPFKAVIEPEHEGAFLSEDPFEIVKSMKNAQIPLMTGITREDGALGAATLYRDKVIEELNNNFAEVAPLLFFYDQATTVSKEIRNFYFGDRKIDHKTKSELTDVFSDTWFYVATDSLITMHTEYGKHPVYFYLFGYQGYASYVNAYKDVSDHYNYGTCHSDELLYLFAHTIFPTHKMKEEDNRTMDIMVALWTNFAKTGNPTPPEDKLLNVKWNPVSSKNHEHYFIDKNGNVRMGENWELDRLKFIRKVKFNSRWNIIRDEL